ncbi:MAG: hypothetical protein JSV01_01255 [Desulfobacterales bacterium]|nr:MAG: hypothetical protein JSV01_01255 [Desulfobacterales bacterium]
MKPDPDKKWRAFLDLANTPRVRLPEFIQCGEAYLDMDRGFSVEDLLPSVEYVRDTIRFMLYHMTMKSDAAIPGFRKVHLGNLEALIDPRWKEKLPYFISCNFIVVSQLGREASKAFLEYCRIPNGERPRFVRRLWKYFPLDKCTGVT